MRPFLSIEWWLLDTTREELLAATLYVYRPFVLMAAKVGSPPPEHIQTSRSISLEELKTDSRGWSRSRTAPKKSRKHLRPPPRLQRPFTAHSRKTRCCNFACQTLQSSLSRYCGGTVIVAAETGRHSKRPEDDGSPWK